MTEVDMTQTEDGHHPHYRKNRAKARLFLGTTDACPE